MSWWAPDAGVPRDALAWGREFVDYKTSMTTYSDPLWEFGGNYGLEFSHALPGVEARRRRWGGACGCAHLPRHLPLNLGQYNYDNNGNKDNDKDSIKD